MRSFAFQRKAWSAPLLERGSPPRARPTQSTSPHCTSTHAPRGRAAGYVLVSPMRSARRCGCCALQGLQLVILPPPGLPFQSRNARSREGFRRARVGRKSLRYHRMACSEASSLQAVSGGALVPRTLTCERRALRRSSRDGRKASGRHERNPAIARRRRPPTRRWASAERPSRGVIGGSADQRRSITPGRTRRTTRTARPPAARSLRSAPR